MEKMSFTEAIESIKIGQYILDKFDEEMSKKKYSWKEVKDMLNKTNESFEKDLKECSKMITETIIEFIDDITFYDTSQVEAKGVIIEKLNSRFGK